MNLTQIDGEGLSLAVGIVRITPELAADILSRQEELGVENVRKTRSRRVDLYGKAMVAGEWQVTGEPVVFTADDRLVTGFHRLNACIAADVPFVTMVVKGVDPGASIVMDTGMPQSPGDSLQRIGTKNQHAIAAIAKLVLAWRFLQDPSRVAGITRTELVRFAESNEASLQWSLSLSMRANKELRVPTAISGAFAFKAGQIDKAEAERFFDLLLTGAGLDEDDPILAARRWMTQRAVNRMKASHEEWAHVWVKAWNRWREGAPMRLMKIPPLSGRGSSRTPLPELV